MKKITILTFDSAAATTATAPMDVFLFAGSLYNTSNGKEITPFFEVEVVTPDGKPAICSNNLSITPHRSFEEVEKTDLILISAIWDIETTLSKHKKSIATLIEHYERGTNLGGLCTGAMILAETGLLDGKDATTHWSVTDVFRQLYPKVLLKPERLFTDAGDLFCSGGFNACIDLSLYLIERYLGCEIAAQTAKAMIFDIGRVSQTPYTCFNVQRNHNDKSILESQRQIEEKFNENINVEILAQENGMSRRTFERRFKNATGDTPLMYLQRTRVEEAKKILETKDKSFDEICYHVGYEDSSFFRKIFTKHAGLRPGEYRKRFQRSWDFR
ncbi:MAG: helix-turn-helix domain-containing protein [Thermodesulfobacteriota bacterium]